MKSNEIRDSLLTHEGMGYRVLCTYFSNGEIISLSYHQTFDEANEEYKDATEDDDYNALFGEKLRFELSEAIGEEYIPIRIDTYVKD